MNVTYLIHKFRMALAGALLPNDVLNKNHVGERGKRQERDRGMQSKIAQKWGFGMAPPKENTLRVRNVACKKVLSILHSDQLPNSEVDVLEAISVVKGLFMRVVRQDQWDWFTVAGQLGYPSKRIAGVIGSESYKLRRAIKSRDTEAFYTAQANLVRLPMRRCLAVHLGRERIIEEPGSGWIYVLSTRELPDLLKVGMTTRNVELRVQEINRATGVVIPFGVRRCWRVFEPTKAEKIVHQVLEEYRVREDREFFHVDFYIGEKLLDEAIGRSGLEIRTLDALAGLAG